jgi:hypothetical protein
MPRVILTVLFMPNIESSGKPSTVTSEPIFGLSYGASLMNATGLSTLTLRIAMSCSSSITMRLASFSVPSCMRTMR